MNDDDDDNPFYNLYQSYLTGSGSELGGMRGMQDKSPADGMLETASDLPVAVADPGLNGGDHPDIQASDAAPVVQVRYAEAQNNAPATNFTRAQVESLVDQANQFASDLYDRYVVSAGGHTADEKAQDLARAQQLQSQLTKMLQGKLPEPPAGNSSYQDNLRGASYYLLHAAVNSGIGWGTGVPRAAGGALFDFEDKVLPDSGLAPPQKIGPLY